MKKQGFTLIELLAVIVILAIIALIAIPMISKIIDKTEDSAVLRSAELYIDGVNQSIMRANLAIIDKTEDSAVIRSAELYIDGVNQSIMRANLANKIRPKECIIQESGDLICDGEYEIKIEATGTKPSSGTLIIEDRAVKSFTDMILDIYKLEMNEDGKISVVEKIDMEKESDYVDSTGVVVEIPKGLTAVVYNNNNWLVADTKIKWHDYINQEWANAVILKNGVTKSLGDTVNVSSEVQGMFVYVPRYEYKIDGTYGTHIDGTTGTQAQPGEIKVNFISKETTTASSGYRIHPAFTFGTTELNGIWVGKFETTGTAAEPTILPNLSPLKGQSVSAQFTTSQIFNTYIKNSGVDFHMVKNSEWGAAAYLSQSRYGKYGNNSYTSTNKEIMINSCSTYVTGVGGDGQGVSSSTTICTSNTYETLKGQAASTTGNITGIYDMNGGASEHVMGVLNKTIASSEFSEDTWPEEKYYDKYTAAGTQSVITTACNGDICYGHALSETSGWYNDYNGSFVSTSGPWVMRGGSYGMTATDAVSAGIFCFNRSNGKNSMLDGASFRVVLTES